MTMKVNNITLAQKLEVASMDDGIFNRQGVLLAVGFSKTPATLDQVHQRLGGIKGDLYGRSKVARALNSLVQDRLIETNAIQEYCIANNDRAHRALSLQRQAVGA